MDIVIGCACTIVWSCGGDYTFKGVVHKVITFCVGSNFVNTSGVKFFSSFVHVSHLSLSLSLPPSLHSEVPQSLSNAQTQYSQWCMLLDSEADIDKIQSVGSELKNCIKSIEWDLEDLDQTISILQYRLTMLPALR